MVENDNSDKMMKVIVLGVQVISAIHAFLGLVSVCVGVVSSIQAEVWLAHSVSPIWSGGFFLITGILGVLCSKKKTAYLIMCFTAFSVVSLVTAVVSIQLLRLGLVNHTTDGKTFQKEHKDVLIIIALVAAGTECLVCLVSTVFSCRMAKAVKKELFKQREGMFHVKDGDDQTNTTATSINFDNISMEERQDDCRREDRDVRGPRVTFETEEKLANIICQDVALNWDSNRNEEEMEKVADDSSKLTNISAEPKDALPSTAIQCTGKLPTNDLRLSDIVPSLTTTDIENSNMANSVVK